MVLTVGSVLLIVSIILLVIASIWAPAPVPNSNPVRISLGWLGVAFLAASILFK